MPGSVGDKVEIRPMISVALSCEDSYSTPMRSPPLRRPGLHLYSGLVCEYQLWMRFYAKYASQRPCGEFRCQSPANRKTGRKFRCRRARPNHIQDTDISNFFGIRECVLTAARRFVPDSRDIGSFAP